MGPSVVSSSRRERNGHRPSGRHLSRHEPVVAIVAIVVAPPKVGSVAPGPRILAPASLNRWWEFCGKSDVARARGYVPRMPLPYADPHKKRGRRYAAMERFALSRPGQWYGRHLGPRIDPWLYRKSGGRY